MNYSDLLQENPGMTPNQAIFIYHLRTNPHGVRQVRTRLDDDSGGMCVLGLGMEAFDIIRTRKQWNEKHPTDPTGWMTFSPYTEIGNVLEIPEAHVNQLYYLNDDHYLSFGQVADLFEAYLKTDRSKGPSELWAARDKSYEKTAFVAKWNQAVEDVKKANSAYEAANDDLEETLNVVRGLVDDKFLYAEDIIDYDAEAAWEDYKSE